MSAMVPPWLKKSMEDDLVRKKGWLEDLYENARAKVDDFYPEKPDESRWWTRDPGQEVEPKDKMHLVGTVKKFPQFEYQSLLGAQDGAVGAETGAKFFPDTLMELGQLSQKYRIR